MKLQKNDPKLTAYLLGELSETERHAVEQAIADQPELRDELDALKKMGEQLTDHYTREEPLKLSNEQRETIIHAARQKRPQKAKPFPPRPWKALTAAAALLLLFLSFSGSLVVFRIVKKSEVCFCPPPAVARPKMSLTKPQVSCKRAPEAPLGELALIDAMQTGIHALEQNLWGPSVNDYAEITENGFQQVAQNPLSTFSIDVDTAAYSIVRSCLEQGALPPRDAVRIEELINYFPYDYAPPQDDTPFATHMELATCPWNTAHKLARIGLKGKELSASEHPPLNLVFLLDVSGSMSDQNKLPLVTDSLSLLTDQLTERDRVSIVVYAGASGLVLAPTADKEAILAALQRLNAGGGTNGGAGIQLAYQTARQNLDPNGVNRVILCTDGDFNIGLTQKGDLNRLIEKEAQSGIFLSVLGFGMGNYKDATAEQLADRGNGNYAYIDSLREARKVLVEQMTGTLITIAKDVKIQVEFNPARVAGYRLIGYENRMLTAEEFNDDTKDAGEIGVGHTVTALYEIVPAGQRVNNTPAVDPLKYQTETRSPNPSEELLTLKLRYKEPQSDTSRKLTFPLQDSEQSFAGASADFRFASSVAGFGMLLRGSPHANDLSYTELNRWAQQALGPDTAGHRRGFLKLIDQAHRLSKQSHSEG